MSKRFKCASFFAGVGGIDLGFEKTGAFETVYANEYDNAPAVTFEANFPKIKVDVRDIKEVQPEDIPDVDVFLAGFPCQAFSIAGYRKGFEDEKGRGTLFFELLRLIRAKKPRVVFLENVKNLVSHDNGNTFRVIHEALEDAGYAGKIWHKVLNAAEYGNMPQNRERIYIVAFRDEIDFKNYVAPDPIPLTKTIKDVIDFKHKVNEKYYYTPGKYKSDVYEKLAEAMDDPDSVYQYRRRYVRKNQSGVVPTLTANQGEGGHNVCIVKTKYGIRKMTPHECFNTQGFPYNFILPEELGDSKLYKQAGNSVCVAVIYRIADQIKNALNASTDDLFSQNAVNEWLNDYYNNCDESEKETVKKIINAWENHKK